MRAAPSRAFEELLDAYEVPDGLSSAEDRETVIAGVNKAARHHRALLGPRHRGRRPGPPAEDAVDLVAVPKGLGGDSSGTGRS
ncbi:hypothetical protein ABZZ37_09970 [Streptomyces sp. NPDC006464]|uniref:hypothetical protein n=1 Tax=Streptomyces sp. NPDC006464 TaxID=3154305 RepID=UPI0033B68C1B